MSTGTRVFAIIAVGGFLGTLAAMTVPTAAVFSRSRPDQIVTPEDYPELVGVTYDAMSGPYFAPKAYSAVAPTIRDNVYDIAQQPESDTHEVQYVERDQAIDPVQPYQADMPLSLAEDYSDRDLNESVASAL